MQHVNLKIFAQNAEGVDIAAAIPVFHRWIQKAELPELLIDVADYSHVPAGPGVMLIAHQANYGLDCTRNRLGLLYDRKMVGDGQGQQSLQQAYDAALAASRRLEQEPEFQGKLRFDATDLEVTFNDRLLHPNNDEGWSSVEPDVKQFFDGIFGADGYKLERGPQGRERLRASIRGIQK